MRPGKHNVYLSVILNFLILFNPFLQISTITQLKKTFGDLSCPVIVTMAVWALGVCKRHKTKETPAQSLHFHPTYFSLLFSQLITDFWTSAANTEV